MQRIPLLLATLSLLPSCATDVVSTGTTSQKASTPYLAESRRCDPNFCILFKAQDSDHDGVADDDERAAGTDPNDPTKYPAMIDLAKLMAAHELPTWEAGNSLMVLVPTRDANGLPIFGGAPSLPARKTGLETAGIKAPDGIDLAGGFTMSRTVGSNDMSFGQLFTAFGREKEGAMPVRLLADAIGWSPTGQWDIETQTVTGSNGVGTTTGTFTGARSSGEPINGTFVSGDNKDSYRLSSSDGSFHQEVTITRDAAGNITTDTSTTILLDVRSGEAGTYRLWGTTNTHSEVSANGRHSVTTTGGRNTEVYGNGTTNPLKPREPRTTVCDDGSCTDMPQDKGSEPGDYPEDVPENPDDGGGICGSGCNEEPDEPVDDEDYAYINPEAAENSGVVTANPDGMRTAIAKLGSTILVVQNDNSPLSNYEVPPTGIHDAYGPIALYGGDPDNTASLVGSFGITPAFVRVPQPEYDPNLNEQKPPMDAPPDGTCLYCFQPPAH